MSLAIIVFGLAGLLVLPVREFPNVDTPIITVRTNYTGANAQVIQSQITEPLEESINGIPDIRTLSSVSRDGSSNITVEFNLSANLETAANDVRDRVSRAMSKLPDDVDPPVVTKSDADANPILIVNLLSNKRNLLDLSKIADDVFKDRLQTLPGISEIGFYGEKRYAIRMYMDPGSLAAYKLTPLDIQTALKNENIELPSGRIEGTATELSIRTLGQLQTTDDINNMVLKEENGSIIKFSDVGHAEYTAENMRSIAKRNGVPCISIYVLPQPGTNHIEIADSFYQRLNEILTDLPDDVTVEVALDTTQYVRRSISEVEESILIAFTLVVAIIFIFLRNWRTTLIPVVTIPVSLIGVFFLMQIFGFSINVLTLLGVVLSIGIVVDDAIVVMENIYAKIEQGMPVMEAAFKGSKEIYFAIISTTVSLVVVFVPIVFLSGLTGRLFREFGLVIAGSVIISAFVSLTLTPMLCSRFIKKGEKHGRVFKISEDVFYWITEKYNHSLLFFLKNRWIALILFIASTAIMYLSFTLLKSELAPMEDRSQITLRLQTPEGTSFERTSSFVDEVSAFSQDNVPETKGIFSVAGMGSGVNSGMCRLFLTEPDLRQKSQQQIADELSAGSKYLSMGKIQIIQDPTIGDRRSGQGVQYVLKAPSHEKLREFLPGFMQAVQDTGAFTYVDSNLKFNKPELRVEINREKARSLNVFTRDIAQTLQLALSGQRFDYYIMGSKQYQVIGEVSRQDRSAPLDLTNLYVRNSKQVLIPLDNLVSMSERSTSPQLYHFNRYISATVTAMPAQGKTLGEAIQIMDSVADKALDDTFQTDLSGQARELKESSGSIYIAFGMALLLIFLTLSAQFESFRDPLTIMITVPLALSGALLSLLIFGQTMNIFSQIGIIMLVGLVTKNGILIVEFANQRRNQGLGIARAVLDAATSRFRPIMMTSLATILGILPIALALGAGSESRVSMGIAVVGGMTFSTFLTLYIVPVFYTFITNRKRHFIEIPDDL